MTNLAIALAEWSFAAFGLVLLVVQMLSHEIGYRLGLRNKDTAGGYTESIGVIVGGILGLLAFVLALTLSFESNRYNERRGGTLAEANAIRTAWLRAEAIGIPRGDEIAQLLEQYAQVRLDFVRAGTDPAELDRLNQETSALQLKIWGHVAAVVREKPSPVSNSLMTGVNEVVDKSTSERFAFERYLPAPVFWLLLGMAVVGMASLGYLLGIRGRTARVMVLLLTAMWTITIVDIFELASARFGQIRTIVAAYEWTLQGFKAGVLIPPPPASQ